ncbi:MAG TPA: type VI secretion system tip protein TssI/VgrG [Thermoanaerobaculia bacterium]|nr:type VI secretion system tip protein TssI/VgrG [Thermoanaerobaculia bacterium]
MSVAALLLAIATSAFAAKITTTVTVSGVFGTLPAVQFDGTEGMSTLFRYDVDVTTAPAHPLDFTSTLGTEVMVTITHGTSTRQLSGMCSRISETATADAITYRLELVPRVSLLGLGENSRIFQDMSVPDIISRVLRDGGIDFQLSLAGSYKPRNYAVQYHESDFNFISRLMEDEGIYYFFTHGGSGHQLVIADNPAASAPLPAAVNFVRPTPKPNAEGVLTWQKTQQVVPSLVTLRDFHFELPNENLEASKQVPAAVTVGTVVHRLALPVSAGLEVYEYPGGYAKHFDGASDIQNVFAESTRFADVRTQAVAATAIGIDGSANVPLLAAGSLFSLTGHPNGNGQYLVTSVHHSVQGAKGDYTNVFTALPAALPFRPARSTPRPHADPQSAVVVGPAGQQLFTDKYGRVKVQFHWDRQGKNDANSSCWVRVAALHAGQENGFTVVPKIGDEVIVDFLEGDPDQPIVIGSSYNPDHLPPLP